MRWKLRRATVALVALALAAVIAALVLIRPYLPVRASFASSEPSGIARFERIASSNGYQYHLGVRANGERELVIDHISSREFARLRCLYRREIEPEQRRRGVIVLDDLKNCPSQRLVGADRGG